MSYPKELRSVYLGTRAQFEASGFIPPGVEWPSFLSRVEWERDGLACSLSVRAGADVWALHVCKICPTFADAVATGWAPVTL